MYIVHNAKWKVHNKISTCRIVGPILFNNPVNSQVYVMELFQPFIAQLTEEEREYAFFQQDGATAHTLRISMSYVHEALGEDRLVSTGAWPPRSPDLSTWDYLWGNLKVKVYSNNRHTIQELKKSIRNAVDVITLNELAKVAGNMLKRAELCA